jgi:hypothetical protein
LFASFKSKKRKKKKLNLILTGGACQNLRPPLSTSPVLNNLIKKCWSANPARRPEFSYIVSVLEKYDHCVKEGMPVMVHQELRLWRSFAKIFRMGCIANNLSIPVHA